MKKTAQIISSVLNSFCEQGLTPVAIINSNGTLVNENKMGADFMIFQEDIYSDAIAVAIHKSTNAQTKLRLNSVFYGILPTVATIADKETMSYLQANRDYLNKLIEEQNGDPITNNENEKRLVAVFSNFPTELSDHPYHVNMDYIRSEYATRVSDIGKEIVNRKDKENFDKCADDTSYEEFFDTFGDNEVFHEDSDYCTEIKFPMYLDKDKNIIPSLDITKKHINYDCVKKCSIDSISIAKDSFSVMVIIDEGMREDAGDAILQKVESSEMTIEQLNEIVLGLNLAL